MPEIYNSIPNARMLLHSLRSVGYTVETAIADIVDNSITAKASVIKIDFDWYNQRIVISDNGTGMDKNELLESMAIGSSDPDDIRESNDLGRFGMGMKTASFSLGKRLCVVSKLNQQCCNASWDLEYVKNSNNWDLIIENPESSNIIDLVKYIDNYNNGTVVSISDIDKIVASDNLEKEKKKFYKMIEDIKKHLSLVFHRFLEGANSVSIFVNENQIYGWDPFIINNHAVQELESEEVEFEGHKVLIQPYILPHKTKFINEDEFNRAGGYKGWLQHQGFYIYRNKRLIMFGTWLGIFKKEISMNLARIQLDINSDSDFDWQIDIKKSKAIPPVYAEDAIRRAAESAKRRSIKVYNSRGVYSKKDSHVPQLSCVWEQRKDSKGMYSFYLNKKHSMLIQLKKSLNKDQNDLLAAYLHLAEKCSPMTLSGITDTINEKSSVSISNEERETLIFEAKNFIRTMVDNGYHKQEIFNLFQQIYDYALIIDCFETIFSEVTE